MKITRRKFVSSVGTGLLAAGVVDGQVQSTSKDDLSNTQSKVLRESRNSGRKVVVLAMDALDPKMTGRFLDTMPALSRIIKEGYSGPILPYASTWGNMDFMSMVTGTAPGTHHRALYPDGSSPITPKCTAEPIWQTLGAVNRRSLLVSFPQGAPSGSSHAAAIACGGVTISHLFQGVVHQTRNILDGIVDTTGHESSGWPPGGGPRVGRLSRFVENPRRVRSDIPGVTSQKPPMEVTLPLTENGKNNWRAVVVAPDTTDYTSILLFSKTDQTSVAQLQVGKWSDWIPGDFKVGNNNARGLIRFKLLSLNTDARGFQLLQSACCPMKGFAQPAAFGKELLEELGPYSAISSIGMYPHDPYWREGVAESLDREMWIADAAELGLQKWDWDFFLTKFSLIDNAKHQCAMPVDPDYHSYDSREAKLYEEVLHEAHKAMDSVFTKYLTFCERNQVSLVIAGDHGMGLNNVICDVNRLLQNAGLQRHSADGEIDWKRTSAYVKRSRQGSEVCVNLKGREKTGSVSPGNFGGIQEKIIDALIDWRDPESGKRAIAYAFKGRDAAVLGYFGSAFGDVVFAYNPGFSWGVLPNGADIGASVATGTNHGAQIPSAETSYNSNLGVIYAWGPGIKPGRRDEEMKGPIPIDEVGTSLSQLLGCPMPKDATAATIRDMLV